MSLHGLGSASGLKEVVEGGQFQPVKWDFTWRSAKGDTAELVGEATITGSRAAIAHLYLVRIGKEWKVAGFNIDEF